MMVVSSSATTGLLPPVVLRGMRRYALPFESITSTSKFDSSSFQSFTLGSMA